MYLFHGIVPIGDQIDKFGLDLFGDKSRNGSLLLFLESAGGLGRVFSPVTFAEGWQKGPNALNLEHVVDS